jgi:hypothetical protein
MEVVRNGQAALVLGRLEPELVEDPALKREQARVLLEVEEDDTLLLEEPKPAEGELERIRLAGEPVEEQLVRAQLGAVERLLQRDVRLEGERRQARVVAAVEVRLDAAHEVVHLVGKQDHVRDPHEPQPTLGA